MEEEISNIKILKVIKNKLKIIASQRGIYLQELTDKALNEYLDKQK